MTDTITCPHCNATFELSQAVAGQLRQQLKNEMAKEMETELQARLSKETLKIRDAARKNAKNELNIELEDLKKIAQEREKKLEEFQARELKLRQEKREVEEQKRTMQLEIARQLDSERKKVEEETTKRVLEERRMQDMEKEKQLNDLKIQIEDLKHKAEVGSQQNRGEVQELDLESILNNSFAGDDITPVGKGIQGADIVQHVRNRNGKLCEKIIWESKRTKHWSDQWVDKLKDDTRKMNGFVSVIVTTTMPPRLNGFAYYSGVWVCDYHSVLGLATALRMQIIHVCHVRDSMTGKDEKMSLLLDYLTSHQFRSRVEAIVETFQAMKTDLEKEKEALRRIWAKRDKEIERITDNTIGMYGEMQGLVGSGMPTIPALDITAIANEQDAQPTQLLE